MIFTPLFVIFFIIVFILVWLFANTIDKRKWVSLLMSLVLAPLAYFFIFYPILNIFSSYHHEKHFNAETWKDTPSLRYEMVNHIKNDSLLINKSKKEVQNILGKAEWYGWNDRIKSNSPEQWNYNLGFKPGAFNNMQECLEIVFKNNTVTSVKQYQLKKTFE